MFYFYFPFFFERILSPIFPFPHSRCSIPNEFLIISRLLAKVSHVYFSMKLKWWSWNLLVLINYLIDQLVRGASQIGILMWKSPEVFVDVNKKVPLSILKICSTYFYIVSKVPSYIQKLGEWGEYIRQYEPGFKTKIAGPWATRTM